MSASIVVIAHAPVGFGRIGTYARGGIARAGIVALIRRRADDGVCPGTGSRLTRIRLRAGIAVIAYGAIGFGRIRAHSRGGIARADIVALIRCRADDRICPCTDAGLATIRLRTSTAVVARRAVGLDRIRAHSRCRIAGADIVALIRRRAHDGVCPGTCTALACIRLRAAIAIVTHGAIGFGGIRADARPRLARARVVAFIRRRAGRYRATNAVHAETARALGIEVARRSRSLSANDITIHGVRRRVEGNGRGTIHHERVTRRQRRKAGFAAR